MMNRSSRSYKSFISVNAVFVFSSLILTGLFIVNRIDQSSSNSLIFQLIALISTYGIFSRVPTFRAFMVYLYFACWTILDYSYFKCVFLLGRILDWSAEDKKRICFKFHFKITELLLIPLYWIRIKFSGEKDLGDNLLITANHQSFLDAVFLPFAINKFLPNASVQLGFLGNSDFCDVPLFGFIYQTLGLIPVKMEPTSNHEENKYDKRTIKNIYKSSNAHLKKGKSLVIFFEGKRNPNPKQLATIYNGVFKISQGNRRPIKLFCIKNTSKIWPLYKAPSGIGEIELIALDGLFTFDCKEHYQEALREIYNPILNGENRKLKLPSINLPSKAS